ncbi:MAG: hypothetical protein PHU85_10360 [Phycisphaerae bacterium]|nr:hypothetical protein [Phycisphaerae bacterium]
MATRNSSSNQAAPRPGTPTSATIRMGSLAGGALGLLGFSLAIVCGLSAGNGFSQIITKAIVTAVSLAILGGLAGTIAGHVIREQLIRRTTEIQQRQEEARQAQVAAAGAKRAIPEGDPSGSGGDSG